MAEAVGYMSVRGIDTGRGLTGDGDNIMPYFAPGSPVTRAVGPPVAVMPHQRGSEVMMTS